MSTIAKELFKKSTPPTVQYALNNRKTLGELLSTLPFYGKGAFVTSSKYYKPSIAAKRPISVYYQIESVNLRKDLSRGKIKAHTFVGGAQKSPESEEIKRGLKDSWFVYNKETATAISAAAGKQQR